MNRWMTLIVGVALLGLLAGCAATPLDGDESTRLHFQKEECIL